METPKLFGPSTPLRTVLIPLPLTGMETIYFVLRNIFGRLVLIPLPLTGMETLSPIASNSLLMAGFNSFTPHGDGNLN